MNKIIKIHCISEAVTPITHMKESKGNESLINKEYIVHNGSVKSVPVLSGNALRHKCVREPGVSYLLKECNLIGKLTIEQANFLFYGGSLTESSLSENMRVSNELHQYFPLIAILGGSLRNQILSGKLVVLRGILFCNENKAIIESMLPEEYFLVKEELKVSEEFINNYQYTRSDIKKNKDALTLLENIEKLEDKSNLMIYTGQGIIPGSIFYHGFILNNVSNLQKGALYHSLSLWQQEGGFIGGNSRIGHGKLKTNFIFDEYSTMKDSVNEYIDHVKMNKENCIQWLQDNFSDKIKKKSKES